MRILFACGGTAGHINPALAVAAELRRLNSDTVILFAGNPHGMEADLIPKAGFDFSPIEIYGFQRKLSPRNIKRNLTAIRCLLTSAAAAKKIISDFRPDIVLGTGGYVSGPVLRTAAKMGIHTIAHESNAFPGVTTKLLASYVDKILLAVPDAAKLIPKKRAQFIVTGNPIRPEILSADRNSARRKLGVDDRICILSFGGSLGADRINQSIAHLMSEFKSSDQFHFIHATGSFGKDSFPALLAEKKIRYAGNPHYDIRSYIDNMPDCLAAADLVISRAGSMTLSELCAAACAAILIPSPNVAENHQFHNAMALVRQDAAAIIEEKNLSGDILVNLVRELTDTPLRLAILSKNAANSAILDGTARIVDEIFDTLK